jgi:hypothetical protein
MTTATISIEVDEATATAFSQASAQERRKYEVLLGLRLRELTSVRNRSLQEIMDDIAQYAKSQGMTPEILESILNDE